MSLKNLSDSELKSFVWDPKGFMENKSNVEKVFGLENPEIKDRIKRMQAELTAEGRARAPASAQDSKS